MEVRGWPVQPTTQSVLTPVGHVNARNLSISRRTCLQVQQEEAGLGDVARTVGQPQVAVHKIGLVERLQSVQQAMCSVLKLTLIERYRITPLQSQWMQRNRVFVVAGIQRRRVTCHMDKRSFA
eukprot:TRINITY_DN2595_c0_g1_i3.p5 TRINITY_DN2595_c0_g1~~TRINITY_DN2595_c0_g1_i3.p5  ORF type:complete len:123 (-),score=18.15 TRINITY_DN2595_c0_g1_i3:1934-2302(-)